MSELQVFQIYSEQRRKPWSQVPSKTLWICSQGAEKFRLQFKKTLQYSKWACACSTLTQVLKNMNSSLLSVHPGQIGECGNAWKNFFKKSFIYLNYGAEERNTKSQKWSGVRNSPPDGAEVRCAEHQIRVRCPALRVSTIVASVSKSWMLFQIQNFFMSRSRHDYFLRLSRSETLAWRDRHTQKRVSRPRHVSRHPALAKSRGLATPGLDLWSKRWWLLLISHNVYQKRSEQNLRSEKDNVKMKRS